MADWHPVLALVEDAPGFWRMVAQYERCYGTVRLVRRGGELGYRADSIRRPGAESELVGYYKTLRAAGAVLHTSELRSQSLQGGPNQPRRLSS